MRRIRWTLPRHCKENSDFWIINSSKVKFIGRLIKSSPLFYDLFVWTSRSKLIYCEKLGIFNVYKIEYLIYIVF